MLLRANAFSRDVHAEANVLDMPSDIQMKRKSSISEDVFLVNNYTFIPGSHNHIKSHNHP